MGEDTPIAAGSEEYLNSEKYEIRSWDLHRSGHVTRIPGDLDRPDQSSSGSRLASS